MYIHTYVYNCINIYAYKYNALYMYKLTIFVPQVVPEAAGVPVLKHEFPVVDVPQCKKEHISCTKTRNVS